MDEIYATLTALLPGKRKQTPSGWISFNAVCCHHRGESQDDRQRGGILPNPNGGFSYHCFNCTFKAGWQPGSLLSNNTKQLFRWLGLSDTDVSKLGLIALKLKDDQGPVKKSLDFELKEKPLPEGSRPITKWAEQEQVPNELLDVVLYLADRGIDLDWYDFMWTPTKGFADRVVIPFYHDGKIVGSTARKIKDGKPKYLTDSPPGYVFNLDRQTWDRKYVIVVEGQFDAIAVDGVAIGHNDPNDTQCARINALGKEVIVVPDRDKPGAKMLKAALEHGWSVSQPPWTGEIKDVADAVKAYGRLYTLTTILHYRESNEIKIQLLKKKLETLDE
jgi:5S rRNA maturation endonuclease (ribonuclease M5)